MPPRKNDLFAELGLLADQTEANPYSVLGISPAYAAELLREDVSNQALQIVTGGMYHALARIYHPDAGKTSNPERFREIRHASQRIETASRAALLRWTKVESAAVSTQAVRQQERLARVVQGAAKLVQANMELGRNPQHFSQLEWSQGVLLRRAGHALLMRQNMDGGVSVHQGEALRLGETGEPLGTTSSAIDFQTFLKQRKMFGIGQDTKIVAYMDGTNRATILDSDLGFMMDVTDAVTSYRRGRRDDPVGMRGWARSTDPLLINTHTPGPLQGPRPDAQIVSFPRHKSGRDTAWQLPMEAAGTVAETGLYRRIRHDKAVGAAAIAGAAGGRSGNYFGMASLPVAQLIEQDVGYSPLLAPGNSLLLYDLRNHIPVVTDAEVIGMIGNGAQY